MRKLIPALLMLSGCNAEVPVVETITTAEETTTVVDDNPCASIQVRWCLYITGTGSYSISAMTHTHIDDGSPAGPQNTMSQGNTTISEGEEHVYSIDGTMFSATSPYMPFNGPLEMTIYKDQLPQFTQQLNGSSFASWVYE